MCRFVIDRIYVKLGFYFFLIHYEKRLLKFNTSKISDNSLEYVMLTSIKKVEHDYIYFYATIHNTNSIDIPVKCSLSTLECELIEFSDW